MSRKAVTVVVDGFTVLRPRKDLRRFAAEPVGPTGFGELEEEPQRDASDDDRDFMSREAVEARRANDRLGFRG